MVRTGLGLDDYTNAEYWKTYAGLTEVPGDIPAEARKVFLFNNPITDVSPGAFSHLCQCTYLSLLDCQLTVVTPGMWIGLTALETFYLPENLITEIKPGAFQAVTSLIGLKLDHNRLSDFRGEEWLGLKFTKISLSLPQ